MGNVQMQMNEKEKKSDTILRKYDLLDQNRMLCLNYQNTINVKWKTQKRLNPIKKSETNRRACKLNLIWKQREQRFLKNVAVTKIFDY